jgi:hypothetical protein
MVQAISVDKLYRSLFKISEYNILEANNTQRGLKIAWAQNTPMNGRVQLK